MFNFFIFKRCGT